MRGLWSVAIAIMGLESRGAFSHARQWRSSKNFVIFVAGFSLFTEQLLYGFLVPILKDMIESRLGLPSSHTQSVTTAMLTAHGLCALLSAPIIAHFADKTPDRKHLLLISLMGCIVGTVLIAYTSSVFTLFLGRIIQAISGSATWIASFAMLVENIEPEQRGHTLALAMSFISCGTITGPVISGTMLQLAGYWAAWSVPLALLGLDAIARLAMVENASGHSSPDKMDDYRDTSEPRESDDLLNTQADGYETMNGNLGKTGKSRVVTRCLSEEFRDPWSDEIVVVPSKGFYRTMLFDPRILAGLANTLGQSLIVAGFDTTLPLFLRNTFGWGSMPVGLIFLGLQGPIVLLGPVVGSIRDRVGCRVPTVLGWALVAPFLSLLALSGRPELSWATNGYRGEALVVVCIAGVGLGFLFTRGGGAFQVIAVTKELEHKSPGLFGPNSANSKVCALMEMAFNVGMLLGPLISGSLLETVGYFYLNCFMSAIAIFIAVISYVYFK